MQKILDAILAKQFDEVGGLKSPDHYYDGVAVRADETEMFAGLASRDKDPRKRPTEPM